MKVLFLHDVLNVADAGQIKEVANGYARNFLLPRGLAVGATSSQQKQMDQHLRAIEKRRERELGSLQELAARVEGQAIVLTANVGDQGRLFGSITTNDIALALGEVVGTPIDRRKIDLTEPIRAIGQQDVVIRFTREVTATFSVTVAAEGEPLPTEAPPETDEEPVTDAGEAADDAAETSEDSTPEEAEATE